MVMDVSTVLRMNVYHFNQKFISINGTKYHGADGDKNSHRVEHNNNLPKSLTSM